MAHGFFFISDTTLENLDCFLAVVLAAASAVAVPAFGVTIVLLGVALLFHRCWKRIRRRAIDTRYSRSIGEVLAESIVAIVAEARTSCSRMSFFVPSYLPINHSVCHIPP